MSGRFNVYRWVYILCMLFVVIVSGFMLVYWFSSGTSFCTWILEHISYNLICFTVFLAVEVFVVNCFYTWNWIARLLNLEVRKDGKKETLLVGVSNFTLETLLLLVHCSLSGWCLSRILSEQCEIWYVMMSSFIVVLDVLIGCFLICLSLSCHGAVVLERLKIKKLHSSLMDGKFHLLFAGVAFIFFLLLILALTYFFRRRNICPRQNICPSTLVAGDRTQRDGESLFIVSDDAASAPSRASEKNQAMDRLMAGRDMAPEDFSALMRRLHADGAQDELEVMPLFVQH